MSTSVESAPVPQAQYLSFELGEQRYAVDILRVQEIKGWDRVTPLPGAPEWVCGVMNLRGAVVPVVDARRRFGLPGRRPEKSTVVIILRVEAADRERIVGIVVDAVSDVHDVTPEQHRAVPKVSTTLGRDVVKGMAAVGEGILVLLDVDRLLDLAARD